MFFQRWRIRTFRKLGIKTKPNVKCWSSKPSIWCSSGIQGACTASVPRSATCNTQRFDTCSLSWQISHSLAISSIPGYLLQLKFHLYSSIQVSRSLSTWSLNILHDASHLLPMISPMWHFLWLQNQHHVTVCTFPGFFLPAQYVAWPLDFSSIGISVLPPRSIFLLF